MTLDKTEIIEVRVSNKELVKGELAGKGENIERKIEITKEIIVELCCGEPSGDHAFDISSTTPAKQAVGRGDFTQWVFRVTPRETGDQSLQLTATAIYPNPDGGSEVQSTVLTDEIKVTINVVDEAFKWLSKHWQWLGLLILIPLMVLYVMRSLKARKAVAVSGNESVFISYRRSDSSGYTLAIYQKLQNNKKLLYLNNSIGTLYSGLANKDASKADSSLFFYKKGLAIPLENNIKGAIHQNIGAIYLGLLKNK